MQICDDFVYFTEDYKIVKKLKFQQEHVVTSFTDGYYLETTQQANKKKSSSGKYLISQDEGFLEVFNQIVT